MKMDNVSPESIMDSLSIELNRHMVFKAGQGAGLSGSFFFFSQDNKFLIKTCNNREMRVLLRMLDPMIEHLRSTDNKSLIARIYGIYTIKTDIFNNINIVIMQNTIMLQKKNNKKMIFDIKGSTINRKVKLPDKFWRNSPDQKKVMKEMNFLEINKDFNH